MSIIDTVKKFVSDKRARAEIERSRQDWIRSDVHRFKSEGMEMLARVGDEIKAMDERLAGLRAKDLSRR